MPSLQRSADATAPCGVVEASVHLSWIRSLQPSDLRSEHETHANARLSAVVWPPRSLHNIFRYEMQQLVLLAKHVYTISSAIDHSDEETSGCTASGFGLSPLARNQERQNQPVRLIPLLHSVPPMSIITSILRSNRYSASLTASGKGLTISGNLDVSNTGSSTRDILLPNLSDYSGHSVCHYTTKSTSIKLSACRQSRDEQQCPPITPG